MSNELSNFISKLALLEPVDLKYFRQALALEFIELQQMADCPQDKIWHAEGDVLTHTKMVMDAALEEIKQNPNLSYKNKVAIYLAALLHDVGKPTTTYTTEYDRVVSPGHSAAAIALARKILYLLGVPFDIHEHVLRLILRHMLAYRMTSRLSPNFTINEINIEYKQFLRLAAELNIPALYHLTRADWLGRQGSNIPQTLEKIEHFRARSEHYNLWNYKGLEDLSDRVFSLEDLTKLGVNDPQEQKRVQYLLLNLSLQGRIQSRDQALSYINDHPNILRPTSAHLYLTLGIPGSGKSTWIDKNLPNIKVISSDKKREELFNDVNWQGDNSKVFQECHLDIEKALFNGEKVIFDATNTKFSYRNTPLQIAFQLFAHTTIIYFDLPLEISLARNKKRDRQVPDLVIARYFNELEVPRPTEAQQLKVISETTNPIWEKY